MPWTLLTFMLPTKDYPNWEDSTAARDSDALKPFHADKLVDSSFVILSSFGSRISGFSHIPSFALIQRFENCSIPMPSVA